MRATWVVVLTTAAACGDNEPGGSTGGKCEPSTQELPATGVYADPYAIDLGEDCVEGGLRDLPGRWFVRDPEQFFVFEYPRYDGTCDLGFRRSFLNPDDHDESDEYKFTRYTWSDGTRYYERSRQVFAVPDGEYELVRGTVGCMRPDGTLAVKLIRYNTEDGETLYSAIGTRFESDEEEGSNLSYVSELGQPAGGTRIGGLNLIVEGDIVYMVGTNGFDTIDVTDKANPVHLAHIDGRLNDVRIVNGGGRKIAFAASEGGDDLVWIIDVTDAAAPDFVSVINEYAHSLQLQGTELYLANYSAAIPKFDVSTPLTPVKTGTAILPGETLNGIHDLTVYGNRIYANNTDAGCVAVDVTNYAAPVELGRKRSAYSHASWAGQVNGKQLVLHGDEGFDPMDKGGAFMRVLDGDPQSPTYMQDLGRFQTRKEVGIHNIEVHGTRAYISYYQDGIRVVDLTDAANPVQVAHYNTWNEPTAFGSAFEGAVGVRKVGDYVYVADLARGLIILREE